MPSDLITVATFQGATEAHIARNQLESSGIQATLADEMTTTAAWFLASAVGGIKLQVASKDAERAAEILTEIESFELGAERWDEDTAEGEFEDDFSEEKEPENAEVEALLTEADALARRAFRAALLGLIFLPLQLYAIWLLTLFLFEPSPANTKSRWRLFWAWIFCLPVVLIALGMATCDLESLFAV